MSVNNPMTPMVQDEGTNQGRVTTINFAGAGVTAAVSGGVATVTIPGGGGGGGSAVVGNTTVDFGTGKSDVTTTVTGQTSIASGSSVFANIRCVASANHTADEHAVEEIDIRAGNIVAGTGFTIYAKTRNRVLYGVWNVSWSWQ